MVLGWVLSHGLPGPIDNTWERASSLPRPTGAKKGLLVHPAGVVPGIERWFSPTAYRGQKKLVPHPGQVQHLARRWFSPTAYQGQMGLMPHPGQTQRLELRGGSLPRPTGARRSPAIHLCLRLPLPNHNGWGKVNPAACSRRFTAPESRSASANWVPLPAVWLGLFLRSRLPLWPLLLFLLCLCLLLPLPASFFASFFLPDNRLLDWIASASAFASPPSPASLLPRPRPSTSDGRDLCGDPPSPTLSCGVAVPSKKLPE